MPVRCCFLTNAKDILRQNWQAVHHKLHSMDGCLDLLGLTTAPCMPDPRVVE